MLWMGAGTWDRTASGKEGGSADQLSGRCRWSLSYATCLLKGDSHLGGAFWMGIFLLLSDGHWEEAVGLGGAWVFPHAVGLWEAQLCVCVWWGGDGCAILKGDSLFPREGETQARGFTRRRQTLACSHHPKGAGWVSDPCFLL